jgi:hypothetical protein
MAAGTFVLDVFSTHAPPNTAPRCGGIDPPRWIEASPPVRPVFTLNRHEKVCLMNRVHHELMLIIHRVILGSLKPSAGLI